MTDIPAIGPERTAVITGGAAGIGLAVAKSLAGKGMNIVLVDIRVDLLEAAAAEVKEAGAAAVMTRNTDVSDRAAVDALREAVYARFAHVDVLMCNAGIQPGSDVFDSTDTWARVLGVNLWGIVNCCQSFIPAMLDDGRPGLVINTGSKQGITTPPGDPAYNVSKSGVKTFTEALQHDLRETDAAISAHLLVPGFVFTYLTRRGRSEKPDGAWTPEQTAAFMFERLAEGDFYIICPDGDVTREMDEKRMTWAMGDIVENRPPLSRWHKNWGEAFQDFMKDT